MRFSTVVAGLLFGLETAAIRVGPIQSGKLDAEVRTCGSSRCVAQYGSFPRSLTMLIARLYHQHYLRDMQKHVYQL
jgi:hypothetical protein